jgi:hypothetical protein
MDAAPLPPRAVSLTPGRLRRALNRGILIALFFATLSLPVLWFGRPSFAPAPLQENRRLAPFPQRSIAWFRDFERWFDDRFGMRDALVYYGSRLKLARTGTPSDDRVVLGRDGWLFFDEHYTRGYPHLADHYGEAPLSASELARIGANLARLQTRLDACGIAFALVVAPDKESVYPDKLLTPAPAGVVTDADQLDAALRQADPALRVIDLRATLRQARALYPLDLYKRTDSHWNTLGAFVGYQAIARRLEADGVLPASPRTRLDAWRVGHHPFPGGDLAVNLLSLPGYFKDEIVTLDPRLPTRAASAPAPADAAFPPGKVVASVNPAAAGTLLVYRDSFSDELARFWAADFGRTLLVGSTQVDGDAVREARPRLVLLEVVQRNLRHLGAAPLHLDATCSR